MTRISLYFADNAEGCIDTIDSMWDTREERFLAWIRTYWYIILRWHELIIQTNQCQISRVALILSTLGRAVILLFNMAGGFQNMFLNVTEK